MKLKQKCFRAAAVLAIVLPGIYGTAFAKQNGGTPPKNRVTMAQARSAALKAFDGQVESEELEFEHGKWIYSFDLKGKDPNIHEVQVDAVTGKVIATQIESPEHEASENAHEVGGKADAD